MRPRLDPQGALQQQEQALRILQQQQALQQQALQQQALQQQAQQPREQYAQLAQQALTRYQAQHQQPIAPKPQELPKGQRGLNIGRRFFTLRASHTREELKADLHKKSKQKLQGTIVDLKNLLSSGSFEINKQKIEFIERIATEASRQVPLKKDLDTEFGKNILEWFRHKDHVGSLKEKDIVSLSSNINSIQNHLFNIFRDGKKKIYRDEDAVIDRLNEFSLNQLHAMSSFMRSREMFQRCSVREEQIDLIQEVLNEKNN